MQRYFNRTILSRYFMSIGWYFLSLFLIPVCYSSASESSASPSDYELIVTETISYGTHVAALGSVFKEEFPLLGPESFSTDSDGNLYVCDTVNRRIQVYYSDFKLRCIITLKANIVPNDIAIDLTGHMYIYDNLSGHLHHVGPDGDIISSIPVDRNMWSSRGALHIVNNSIYISSSDEQDCLIGEIDKGILNMPSHDRTNAPSLRGVHAASGRMYLTDLDRFISGTVRISDSTGKVLKIVKLDLPGIVSIRYLDEDKDGNFYIQTEKAQGTRIYLCVYKYDINGKCLDIISFPDNNYSIWSIKLLDVSRNGDIYQVVPKEDAAVINLFSNNKK